MSKRIPFVLILISALFISLFGCSESRSESENFESASEPVTASVSETDSTEEGKTSTSETLTSNEATSTSEAEDTTSPEIDSNQTSAASTEKTTDTTSSEEHKNPVQNPVIEPTLDDHPTTDQPIPVVPNKPKEVHASSVSLSFCGYESKNERTPYIKSSPIYEILYSGDRVQVGDTLKFTINSSPNDHSDRICIEVSDGLEYSLSGNTLSVTVKSDDNCGAGRIAVSALAENGNISASAKHAFSIDPSCDPYTDMSGILADYIRCQGMSFTSFEMGYTASDPSKSITNYSGAPAWDDMLEKSTSDWISRCFWLIDQYKMAGYNKVNFIITETSIGFSASK